MKNLKKINMTIIILVSLASIYISFFGNIDRSLYKYLIIYSIIPVMLLPYILELIFKFKINEQIKLLYLLFIFFAHYLGTIVDLYQSIALYDKLMHLFSGVVTCFLALILIKKFKIYDNKNIVFNILFIILVVLSIASLWEFYEFTCDNIFSRDAQKVVKTGVDDTMLDMIMAFTGALIFITCYIFEHKSNNKLFITNFINNLN